jgi:hypothetical protein
MDVKHNISSPFGAVIINGLLQRAMAVINAPSEQRGGVTPLMVANGPIQGLLRRG